MIMPFEKILRAHVERYPEMQIQDVYKLIHQASLGSEHAVENPEHARAWMLREISEMGSGPVEPVIDPISENAEIVRVHLRPFAAQGGDIEALLNAFIRTANEYRGNFETLETSWKIAERELDFPVSEMDAFIRLKRTEGYPPVHHSAVFEKNHRPAYRVIWKTFL